VEEGMLRDLLQNICILFSHLDVLRAVSFQRKGLDVVGRIANLAQMAANDSAGV
jgi:hypothetical protein